MISNCERTSLASTVRLVSYCHSPRSDCWSCRGCFSLQSPRPRGRRYPLRSADRTAAGGQRRPSGTHCQRWCSTPQPVTEERTGVRRAELDGQSTNASRHHRHTTRLKLQHNKSDSLSTLAFYTSIHFWRTYRLPAYLPM